ncbi:MAG: hypothetical protein R3F20_06250 [Planctomycetota bacterium]
MTGRFDHLALDESTDVLYVVALGNDTLEVVDLGRGERTRTIRDLPRPTGIAIDQRSGRFAVASSGDGRCHIWGRDLGDPVVVEGLDDADNLRYEAETERYLVGYGESLGIFSALDGRKLGAVPLGGHPESFQLEPGTGASSSMCRIGAPSSWST